MGNARKIALRALVRVEIDRAYSNLVLGSLLEKETLSVPDKALASVLFYGVLNRRITLDYLLNRLSKTPVKKMQTLTKNVLRMGLYQLLYLDRVPASAAVNESVNLVKNSKESANSGFVNAVLRAAVRRMPPLPEGDTPEELAVRYSFPREIVLSLVKDYGKDETKATLEAFLDAPPLTVRVNTAKITDEQFCKMMVENGHPPEKTSVEHAYRLYGGINFSKNRMFCDGLYYVQDAASQCAALAVGAVSGERILDVCAAPGGKSFTMANEMHNQGEIISCDLLTARVRLIAEGARRLGLTIVQPKKNDATVYHRGLGLFDAVLCDVPCSGYGVIRRKPEIKYKPVTDFTELINIQALILAVSAGYVKSGGRLVYSTCTLRKEENDYQITKFLSEHPEFALCEMKTDFPGKDGDGFFHAVMQKE